MELKSSMNELTIALALGSITFLGIFLIGDHFFNLWVLFENYAKDAIWGLTFSIPIVVLVYTIGIFVNSLSDIIFSKINKEDIKTEVENLATIAKTERPEFIQYYITQRAFKSFFQGCTIAFIILAIGTFSTYKWVPGYELFSFIVGFGILCIAMLSPMLSNRFLKKERELIKAIQREFK